MDKKTDAPKKVYEPTPEQVDAARKANESANSARMERMNAIADGADKERAEDTFEFDGDKLVFPDPEQQAAEGEARRLQAEGAEDERIAAEAEDASKESARKTAEEADEKEINGVKHYLVVVNGKEKWLTLKEIRERAQKVDSADEYLQAASDSVRRASELALSPKDGSVEEGSDSSDADLETVLRSAVMGDEASIKKLASALKRPATPAVSLEQIDQRLSLRAELSRLSEEQADVLNDPYLGRLFQMRLNEMKAENAQTPVAKAYRQIGDELRKAFPEKFKKSPLAEREERKRTLPQVPAASNRGSAPPEDEEEESVESVIAKMAKARGQTPYVHRGR